MFFYLDAVFDGGHIIQTETSPLVATRTVPFPPRFPSPQLLLQFVYLSPSILRCLQLIDSTTS